MKVLMTIEATGLVVIGVALTVICTPFVFVAGLGINAANHGLETLARMRRGE